MWRRSSLPPPPPLKEGGLMLLGTQQWRHCAQSRISRGFVDGGEEGNPNTIVSSLTFTPQCDASIPLRLITTFTVHQLYRLIGVMKKILHVRLKNRVIWDEFQGDAGGHFVFFFLFLENVILICGRVMLVNWRNSKKEENWNFG